MPQEVWTSPHGHFQVIRHVPEEYNGETREERAEPLDLDLSVFQHEDPRTPEERAKWRKEALAELDEYIKEEGLELNEEQQADLDAFIKYVGWRHPDSEPAPQ